MAFPWSNGAALPVGQSGTYVPPAPPFDTWLPVRLGAEILQPAVNYDEPLPGGPVWFITKGLPQTTPTYRGGALYARRLQWVNGVAQWQDAAWVPLDAAGNEYRNYFDLDDAGIRAPQQGDTRRRAGSGINISKTGSRLCLAFIRGGHLWVAHHVGLSGTSGTYTGDASGNTVDRSAIQWFKLATQAMGEPLAYVAHGRIFDPAPVNPVWYHFPSVAVNAPSDALLGFSGSGNTTYFSAYATWKLALSASFNSPQLLQAGAQFCLYDRGPDYSSTCADPVDDLALWTFQEHAALRPMPDNNFYFYTSATQLLSPR